MLLAFRADVNCLNEWEKTPLDVYLEKYPKKYTNPAEGTDEVLTLLKSYRVVLGDDKKEAKSYFETKLVTKDDCYTNILQEYHQLTMSLRNITDVPLSLEGNTDFFAAIGLQFSNMRQLQKAGSRMLLLDGGGMKGLMQIDILCEIEKRTGKKIIELFDWIVGSSIGAVMAMALVHGKSQSIITCACMCMHGW